jgi:hypothetical protein
MAFPLQALTGKRTYQWGDEQEKAFDELRNAMVRAPVLALPNATDPFIKGPMVIVEPQKPLHLLFILRPWPVFYIFDISWPNVYSSRSHYSTQELYFFLKQFTFFGLMAFPLQALTGKRTYQWGDEQEKAFDELRNAMVRAPVLALPNATDPFPSSQLPLWLLKIHQPGQTIMVCPDREMPTHQVMPKLSREPNNC